MHAKEQERRVPPNAALSTSQKFLSLSSSCCDSCAIPIVLVILEVQQESRTSAQLNSRLANLVIGIHRANQHFSGESVTLPWLTQSVLVQVRVRPRTSTWHSLACPLFELPAHPCSWLEYSLQLA